MGHGAPGEPGADPATIHKFGLCMGTLENGNQCDTGRWASTSLYCWRHDEDTKAADGLARLEHDVVTLPPDQRALGLVEAILEHCHASTSLSQENLLFDRALIQGLAERLKVLLEKGEAQS